MRLAVLLALVVLASGCASRDNTPTTTSTTQESGLVSVGGGPDPNGTAAPGPSPQTMNLTQDPVEIRESGTLTNGASKDWSWHVAPGFTTFTVQLRLSGPQGAPAYGLVESRFLLEGGDPFQVVQEHYYTFGTATSQCLICHDGQEAENQPGLWSLRIDADPSAADYTLDILVSY